MPASMADELAHPRHRNKIDIEKAKPSSGWCAPNRMDTDEIVRKVVAYVRSNLTEAITLLDLERVTGCSTFQIIRAFRREAGVTPHAYIMSLRVHHATKLLRSGRQIIHVAADTGFADQSHFTKHFKRVHGQTPGAYLRREAP